MFDVQRKAAEHLHIKREDNKSDEGDVLRVFLYSFPYIFIVYPTNIHYKYRPNPM